MTITLHWWITQIIFAAIGIITVIRGRDSSPFDFLPALIFIVCMVCAVAFTVGHFA